MRTLKWEDWSCPDYNLQPQLAFYQNGNNTRVNVYEHFSFYSAIAVQHLLLFALVFSIFSSLITSDFLLPTKTSYKKHNSPDFNWIFIQNNSALWNVKYDWSISFIQVGRNRTHLIFQKLYHTNISTSSLHELAILHSQTSWIIQVTPYKLFNIRPALIFLVL